MQTRTQKISEVSWPDKELWSPLDREDLVFEVVEEAFVKDIVKVKNGKNQNKF